MPQGTLPPAGGQGTVTVATTAECAWTAASSAPWITGLTPASSQGGGSIRFQVSPNPGPQTRTGQITLNDLAASITQAGSSCALAVAPDSQQISAAGGTGQVAIATDGGCAWTATSDVPWLTVTAGGSGIGNGTVEYAVDSNAGAMRAGGLTIGAQLFLVTQQAAAPSPCQATLQPATLALTPAGGTATIAIAIDAGCAWTAVSHESWLTVSGPASGTGSGSTTISAVGNTGASRAGTLTIAGVTYQVTQTGVAACSFSISPTSLQFPSDAATSSPIAVTAAAGCAWTAVSNDSWITVQTGTTGTGDGTVTFSITKNVGNNSRTGTLTIAGLTFTVNQDRK